MTKKRLEALAASMVSAGVKKLTLSKQGIEIEVSEQAIAASIVERRLAPVEEPETSNVPRKKGGIDAEKARKDFERVLLASA